MSLSRRIVYLKPIKEGVVPYNYQYEIMQNLYYYISISSKEEERFLHEEGYKIDDRPGFKLFNFSLRFIDADFQDEYIKVNEKTKLRLIISGKDEIINHILKGLLHIKKVKINDNFYLIENIVKDVDYTFKKVMLYKAISPIVTTTINNNGYIVSLRPYVEKYYVNLANNLKKKYKIIYGEEFEKLPLYFDIDNVLDMREKSHVIKGIFKIGYLYDIWVETTPKMQRIIYYLGLGENNASGAGCMEIKKGVMYE